MADYRAPATASELYALSSNTVCEGPDECHWCGAPCHRRWAHDDLPPAIGRPKSQSRAKRPGNGYVCNACWTWKRPRVTAMFLGGGYKDGQCAENWSWYVAGNRASALRFGNPLDRDALYERLLDPPPRFFLSLRQEGPNLLQYAILNTLDDSFTASSPVAFTLDNKPLSYSVYELEYALANGPEGTEPGVQTLLRLFGMPPKKETLTFAAGEEAEAPVRRGRGRPPKVKTDVLISPQNPSQRPLEP